MSLFELVERAAGDRGALDSVQTETVAAHHFDPPLLTDDVVAGLC